MRYLLLLFIGVMLEGAAWGKDYAFALKGDIINAKDGKVELYSPTDSVNPLLSTEIKEGMFFLKGRLEERGYYILNISGVKYPIVLDAREMTLYGNNLQPDTKLLKGSPAVETRLALDKLRQEKYEDKLQEGLQKLLRNEDGVEDNGALIGELLASVGEVWTDSLLDFVRSHPGELYVPVYVMREMGNDVELGRRVYDLLSPEIQRSQPGRLLKHAIECGE